MRNRLIATRRVLALGFWTASLAACGDLPRAFEDRPVDRALVAPAPFDTVVVLPVAGLETVGLGERFAAILAEILGERDIAASLGGGDDRTLFLSGRATMEQAAGLRGAVANPLTIQWNVTDASGRNVGGLVQTATARLLDWRRGDDALFDSLSRDATPKLAPLLSPDRPAAPRPAATAPTLPTVATPPATGAPGNGNTALPLSMKAKLRAWGVPLTLRESEADLLLLCDVGTAPGGNGKTRVSVTWRVVRRDGAEIGRIDQENDVDPDDIEGDWGRLSDLIAHAAALGLIRMIETPPSAKR